MTLPIPAIPWPSNARPLSTEDAITTVENRDHLAPEHDDVADMLLILMLSAGAACCAMAHDHQLLIQPTLSEVFRAAART